MKKLFRDFTLKNLAGIILGSFVAALGLNLLLAPNQIAPGGASGLAVLVNYLIGTPVSLVLLLINVPLFILGWFVLGPRFGINTLLGSLLLPFFVALTEQIPPLVTGDLLLVTIYGGIVMGAGIGIVYRFQGTTGGTALAAQIVHKLTGITLGQALLGVDFLVVILAGVVFDAELALYALISVWVSSRLIDMVQQGLRRAKTAFIVSDESAAIAATVLEQMQRGATLLEGQGAWSGKQRNVLMVVVGSREISKLKALVTEQDPQAFILVSDAHEVLGEGFRRGQ